MYGLKKIVIVGICIAAPLLAWSQSTENNMRFNDYLRSGGGYGLGLSNLGLLDPSRMSFTHSYSMTYATSDGESVMRGLFMESIGYKISNPLFLTLNLGYLHQPYSTFDTGGLNRNGAFIGGAALDWRPAKNMFLHFEVANYPSYGGYGYHPYWNPYPFSSPQPNLSQPSDPDADP
jgi:hypothetical protein